MKRRTVYAALLFAVLLAAHPRDAKAALDSLGSGDKPIDITADSLEVLQAQHTATFRGKVKAVQGDVTLTADEMKVFYRDNTAENSGAGAVSKIEATGNVFLVTPAESARGKKGIYEVDKKMVYLLGDVVLTRGDNALKGERLEYNFATGRSLVSSPAVTGTKDGKGRVRAVFVPEKKDKK